jgi:hypothetical protein
MSLEEAVTEVQLNNLTGNLHSQLSLSILILWEERASSGEHLN